MQSTHQCCVYRNLRATPHWKIIDNDFESATVMSVWCKDVHVSHHDVRTNAASCFSADARRDALKGKPNSTEHPRCGASCTMVPQRSNGRQLCTERGAKRRRRNKMTRKRWDGMVVSRLEGVTVSTAPARGPACDLVNACVWSGMRENMSLRNSPSTRELPAANPVEWFLVHSLQAPWSVDERLVCQSIP